MSEFTVGPFPEKKFYIGHQNRMVYWRDGIFCHGVLNVFQESFRTTLFLFLTDLVMNGPVGRRCAVSLDMLFLEVFNTTLSLNKHINRHLYCCTVHLVDSLIITQPTNALIFYHLF